MLFVDVIVVCLRLPRQLISSRTLFNAIHSECYRDEIDELNWIEFTLS